MATFSTDLILGILYRLPVKTLIRFKCVSKLWDSLIQNPDFAKIHHHHSFKTNTNLKLLLDCRRTVNDDKAYSVDFKSLGNLVQLTRPFTTAKSGSHSRIFGSCNGLVAVYHYKAGIALWNPSTRNYHYLPAIKRGDWEGEFSIRGFGYDVIEDDYKVVEMMMMSRTCMIYSLKANSWRRIKDCPYQIPYREQDGAYIDGSPHWVGDEKDKYLGGKLIFGLDLSDEEFHEVPECEINIRNFSYKNVGFLRGNLCVFHEDINMYFGEPYMILWVMKEYGVKESWTELVHISGGQQWRPTHKFTTKAISYSRSGDRILLDNGGDNQPVWFDLENQTAEVLGIKAVPHLFSAMNYVESLVSVMPIHH